MGAVLPLERRGQAALPDWEERWSHAAPLLTRALAKAADGHSLDFVHGQIAREQATLWTLPNSAAVSETIRDFHVWLAAGDWSELGPLEAEVTGFATSQGFDRMSMVGRSGWTRRLAPLGWKPLTLLVKAL